MTDVAQIKPKPGSLVARMFEQEAKAQPQSKGAGVLLGETPEIIDVSAWYEKQIELLDQLLYLQIKAVAGTLDEHRAKLVQHMGETHAALKAHAGLLAGDPVPKVLARDGRNTISYEKLAEARAKVKVLTAENGQLREELAAAKREAGPGAVQARPQGT